MENTQPEFIIIGTVLSTWGIHGQIKVDVETDFPERYAPSSQIYLDRKPMVIESVSWHKGRAIVKLEGLDDEDEAAGLKGHVLEIHRSQLFKLPEDAYYHFELIGLKVKTTEGEMIGEISEILSMASADIYVVKGDTGDILLPATDEVVKSVDTENGILVIEAVEGLLDLNARKPKQR